VINRKLILKGKPENRFLLCSGKNAQEWLLFQTSNVPKDYPYAKEMVRT
jgi:hypothetical protein